MKITKLKYNTLSPSEISAITVPSAGFIVGNFLRLTESTNSLFINN